MLGRRSLELERRCKISDSLNIAVKRICSLRNLQASLLTVVKIGNASDSETGCDTIGRLDPPIENRDELDNGLT
jgi:hypothetical protein